MPVQFRNRRLGHHHVGKHVSIERFVLLSTSWSNHLLRLFVWPKTDLEFVATVATGGRVKFLSAV